MMQEITARLFELIIMTGAGVCFIGILAAGIYDLQAVARRKRIGAAARKLRRKSAQPPVTVVVYAHNDSGTIIGCLESLRRSRYHNYDVVVVDNASHDGTRRVVRRYMRKHPRFALGLYAKRKHSPLQHALRQAYQNSPKGELVVMLDASSRPSRSFLTSAAARFLAEPDLTAVSAAERTAAPLAFADLLSEYAYAAMHVIVKCLGLLRIRRDDVGLNGIYRSGLVIGGMRENIRYEGGLLLPLTRRVRRPNIALRRQLIQTALAIAAFLLMSYAMVAAASLMSPLPLFLSWSLVAAGSLAVIWSDESISMLQKIQLTLSATLVYFLLYVTLLRFLLEQMIKRVPALPKAVRPDLIWHRHRRAIS